MKYLGLILALLIQLQLVAACGTGAEQATVPVAASTVPPVVPQGPSGSPAPPSETTPVATPPSWNVLNQADLDRLEATKSCVGCELNGADLASADLRGANLSFSYLIGVNLTGADLTGANLAHSRLYNANLSYANLTNANLTFWADLTRADLTGANLSGADLSAGSQYLSGANLTDAVLNFAILSGTIWIDSRICKDTSIGQCE